MSDEESNQVDPVAHQKLLAGIQSIVRTQDVQKVTRTEPTAKKSEFHLVKTKFSSEKGSRGAKPAIKVDDLLGILKKSGKNTNLSKELIKIKTKKSTLKKPLEKPVADRIERDALYGKAQKNLDLWEPVVTASDVAPQTVFPLQYGKVGLINEAPQKLSQYRVKSDLMKAMEDLDRKYQKDEPEEQEEDNKYTLTLEELREKRKEAARQKMREAYKIAKGRRMNKIKSKKFHKLMKREKIRSQIKQFEELQKTDPEAALKQLELIEKQRYQERATLRHKNTGSWAKNMQIRAKYDMNVRKELAEQLSIGKELMAKQLADQESSESGEEEIVEEDEGEDNPWVRKKGEHEEEANKEFTSGYRKYWDQRNKVEQMKKQMEQEETVQSDEQEGDGSDEEQAVLDSEDDEQDGEDSEEERQLEVFKKKVKKSMPTATSAWEEEDLNEDEEYSLKQSAKKKRKSKKELNIEEIFDDAQELLQEKVKEKLANVRTLTDAQKMSKNKQRSNTLKRKTEEKSSLAFKKKATLGDADIGLDETSGKDKDNDSMLYPSNLEKFFTADSLPNSTESHQEVTINPKQFVQMKPKHLLNAIPDLSTGGEFSGDEDDDGNPERNQKLTIAEAFEDDDIVADFEQEKQDERDRNKPKELDTFLPGWGSWGGSGIKQSAVNKTRRKMFKPVPVLPRRDDNKERVIINEDAISKQMSSHLVNELPFPFVSVKDYEASLRAPVGRTFIPETAHSTLVEPRVVTKMGAIIEPMKKDILLQDVKKSFRVGGKQYNKAIKQYEEFLEAA